MQDEKENKSVLVTGATGFVGSHLVRRLVADFWDVHIIVRSQSKLEMIRQVHDKIRIHTHDETIECMIEIVKNSKPSIVFHLASLFLVNHKASDIERLINSNVLFGTQLIEAMVLNDRYNLINTGTSWQHYNNDHYNPVNLYAATKQAFEAILKFYVSANKLNTITLKLFDTYGPNDPRPKIINSFKKIAEDQQTLAMSPGDQLIDIVYIDDVIDAFLTAADRFSNNEVNHYEDYAVSSGAPIKLRDFAETFEKITGKNLHIEWGGCPYRNREVMVPWNNGKRLPGWIPKISLYEGIKKITSGCL